MELTLKRRIEKLFPYICRNRADDEYVAEFLDYLGENEDALELVCRYDIPWVIERICKDEYLSKKEAAQKYRSVAPFYTSKDYIGESRDAIFSYSADFLGNEIAGYLDEEKTKRLRGVLQNRIREIEKDMGIFHKKKKKAAQNENMTEADKSAEEIQRDKEKMRDLDAKRKELKKMLNIMAQKMESGIEINTNGYGTCMDSEELANFREESLEEFEPAVRQDPPQIDDWEPEAQQTAEEAPEKEIEPEAQEEIEDKTVIEEDPKKPEIIEEPISIEAPSAAPETDVAPEAKTEEMPVEEPAAESEPETSPEITEDNSEIPEEAPPEPDPNSTGAVDHEILSIKKMLERALISIDRMEFGRRSDRNDNARLKAELAQKEIVISNMVSNQADQAEKIGQLEKQLEEKKKLEQKYIQANNAVMNASAALFGAIHAPLAELERELSILFHREEIEKDDISALMDCVCDLRRSLEGIALNGSLAQGVIDIRSCESEENWKTQAVIPYNEETQSGGEPGAKVIVRSRGFVYYDNTQHLVQEPAKVYPVQMAEEESGVEE